MFQGKRKAITFSYDDGVTQDRRLIELFDKYDLKATFNLNSGLFNTGGPMLRDEVTIPHVRMRAEEVEKIYRGHEVAAHCVTHRFLVGTPEEEIIEQVENDRLALSDLVGYEVRGFAFPGGGINHDARAARIIRENTGVKYCRTTDSSGNFELPTDLHEFKPTVYHHVEFDRMIELGKRFVELQPERDQLFYIWGHAYEFDIHNTWDKFEEFLKMISHREDIYYGTNSDVLLDREDKIYRYYSFKADKIRAANDNYPSIKTVSDLYDALDKIWCAETCAPRLRDGWSKENKTLGQCSITAFLAQDIFGGEVYGILRPDGNYHCYNAVGESVFDLTSEQFGKEKLDYSKNFLQHREEHFAKEEKRKRYEMLKNLLK